MNTVRTIKMSAQEVKRDNKKFIACSAEINGKWYKIKFTQDCINSPKTRGIYELTIDFDECSIEKGKKYENAKGKEGISNDTIWVKCIAGIRKYTEEELKATNRMAMSAIFGE